MQTLLPKKPSEDSSENTSALKRRAFLRSAGFATATTAILLSGCEPYLEQLKGDDADETVNNLIRLGGGDLGVLNYAFALEQLEAAFYTKVVETTGFGSMFDAQEQDILADIQKHEVIHRDFFKAALGKNAIPDLQFNFSSIDFNDRMSIWRTASAFEDLGVAAYNGAGKLLKSTDYLLLAGKIVSVEARHAAQVREVIFANDFSMSPTSFAGDDVVDMNGLDQAFAPAKVLTMVAPYIAYKLDGSSLQ